MGTIYHKKKIFGGNPLIETIGVGGGYAPIGTIIAYMGTTAPQDYLACDGSTYNITDYKQLARFIEAQFGSKNYFGGDGTTTFAVPDLRGEFLRGTGTNSHSGNGNGAAVGTHQNGTQIPNIVVEGSTKKVTIPRGVASDRNTATLEFDCRVGESTDNKFESAAGTISAASAGYGDKIVIRPTNTSVLYCIKAVCAGDVYSTDERVVGTWIDGKPIYQKTVTLAFSSELSGNSVKETAQTKTYTYESLGINNLATVVDIKAVRKDFNMQLPWIYVDRTDTLFSNVQSGIAGISTRTNWGEYKNKEVSATIQYTKTTD